ncbi:hypothetical protein LINPERHAP2_LOCUS37675 [Linum perenne]
MYNNDGQVVDGRAGGFFCRDAIVVEAKAVLVATEMARNEDGVCVIISDCKTLVDAIDSPAYCWPWECAAYIAAIRDIMITNHNIQICWQGRESVRVADMIARRARDNCLEADWLLNLPH